MARYSGKYIELDLVSLEAEMVAGNLPVKGIHKLEAILQLTEDAPTFPKRTKTFLTNCAKRDNELLIEGVIPKRFFRILGHE